MPESLLVHRLQSAVVRFDVAIDRAAAVYRQQLRAALGKWLVPVRREVTRRLLPTGKLRRSPTMPVRVFDASGPRTVATRALQSLPAATEPLRPAMAPAGLRTSITQDDRALLNAVYRVLRTDFEATFLALERDARALLDRAQATSQDGAEALAELDELVEAVGTRAASAYDTALATYAQGLLSTRTPEVAHAYVYVGPIDGRSRRFCLTHVAKVWTRDRIDKMNNGITGNTFLNRGGPNCRHLWWPTTEPSLVALANTGKVVSAQLGAAAQRELGTHRPLVRRTA